MFLYKAHSEFYEIKKKVYTECKAQEGGTDSDIDGLLKLQPPTNQQAKCILACSNEKLGFVIISSIKNIQLKECL